MTPIGAEPTPQRPPVNWDVVGTKWQKLSERARAEWLRLAG